MQYIGEMCRYLVSLPESPLDRQHRVRVMFGNGLQDAVWRAVQRRFGIPLIAEGYAATEGNANISESRPRHPHQNMSLVNRSIASLGIQS